MCKKIFSFLLCLVLLFSVAAPRAAATGVEGAALTLAEMAGVVSLIAGSLGIVFTGAGDMHDACEAFVRGLDPSSAAYLALASAVAQGSTIYIAGANAVNYLGGLVDDVRSFFIPGDDVVVQGSGVHISNLGQIQSGSSVPDANSGVAMFQSTESPVVFYDESGNPMVSIVVSSFYNTGESSGNSSHPSYKWRATGDLVYPNSSNSFESTVSNRDDSGTPYLYFGTDSSNRVALYAARYSDTGVLRSWSIVSTRVTISSVASVSGGGGEEAIDIPVFQEAGALSPDLVGGVWDKLAEDAAAQNGNVTIDTNVGTYVGGATGYVDGDPGGVIAAPQAPSLGGAGSTRTETDTSTGTTSQTTTQTGAQAVPNSTTANPAISATQATTTFNGATLTLVDIFPFCIPFDILAMLRGLAVGRDTPHFDVRLYYPGWLDYTYTFDFSDFEDIASVLRTCELAAFAIGLAAVTRRFIKW